jgi:tRNA 2-thiouridine synthesizing protein C
MKQSVAVLLSRAPYGRIHVPEGLRAARGIAAGFDHHDVTVAFVEDGAYAARAGVDREALNMAPQIEDLHREDGQMVVDATALRARDIDESELAPDIEMWSAEEISGLVTGADRVVTF